MADGPPPNLFGRTLGNLQRAWSELASSARGETGTRFSTDLPDRELARLRRAIEACIDARADEYASRARAAEIGRDLPDPQ